MFSCEFCKISRNTFYYRTPLVATSVFLEILHEKPGNFIERYSGLTETAENPWKDRPIKSYKSPITVAK